MSSIVASKMPHSKEQCVKISISLPVSLVRQLRGEADLNHRTLSRHIRALVVRPVAPQGEEGAGK